jgi:hypothetical protein
MVSERGFAAQEAFDGVDQVRFVASGEIQIIRDRQARPEG